MMALIKAQVDNYADYVNVVKALTSLCTVTLK